jgi:hypothetical protein
MLDSKHDVFTSINILRDAVNNTLARRVFSDVYRVLNSYFQEKLNPSLFMKVVLSKSKTEQIVKSRYKQIKLNLQNRSVPFLSNALLWAEAAHYKSRLM